MEEDEGLTVEADYRKIVGNIPVLVFCHDMGGDITYANPHAIERIGCDPDELLRMNIFDFIPPDEAEKVQKMKEKRKKGDKSTFRFVSRIKEDNGKVFPVQLSCTPFVNSSGEMEFLIVARDISERRKVRSREEFLHSLLRHDVRNKAQIARGYLELLQDVEVEEKGEKFLQKALKSVKNSLKLIEKVRTLLKIDGSRSKEIDVNLFVENAISEKSPLISKNGVEIKHKSCGCRVVASPLLEEVFSNLIENAIVHSNCDNIVISSRETEEECIVSVEDDGCGIDNEEKEKVLEKGYRKSDSPGSGLGLYLVKEVVETHGGSITVEDSELDGACFEISLKKP
ncbi:hypothetical protein AKJ51_00475 [candidate division MSBL1 archaeon SCGC-AAA382A20]|uniref:histidine kinase n=1 Tax=candidate division MSBL1 archaeon SCGC-AAA382A20 TaxID=1698280 RepID=A0A133VML7_9EURY|nr:hypothetical protein AKJ51_00475 [candidate division MSBL1 archaeon SCGC-AAA382A20]